MIWQNSLTPGTHLVDALLKNVSVATFAYSMFAYIPTQTRDRRGLLKKNVIFCIDCDQVDYYLWYICLSLTEVSLMFNCALHYCATQKAPLIEPQINSHFSVVAARMQCLMGKPASRPAYAVYLKHMHSLFTHRPMSHHRYYTYLVSMVSHWSLVMCQLF